jgi:hypothetical protein
MPMLRHHARAGCAVWLAATVWLTLAATLFVAEGRSATLSFAGVGDEPAVVDFTGSRQDKAIGTLPLVVQTDADKPGRLMLRFLPASSGRGPARVEPLAAAPPSSPVVIRRQRMPRVGRSGAVPLTLEFRVPQGASLSRADGILFARLMAAGRDMTGGSAKTLASATLRVEGRLGEIEILPARVTLQGTYMCAFACGDDSATVQVRGVGTGALPDQGVVASAELSGGRSGTTRVELHRAADGGWTVQAINPGFGEEGWGEVGERTGKMPLVIGDSRAPQLEVVEKDGFWFGIAAAVVIFGSLLGAIVIPYYGIGRRRRILSNALKAALERYKEAVRVARVDERQKDISVPRPAGYEIGRELGAESTWNSDGCQPYQGPRGVRALLCRIATSREEADFTEAEREATGLIAMIDGWIALEPVIAQAQRTLAEAALVEDKDGKKFVDSGECKRLAQLVDEIVIFRPGNLDRVEERVSELRRQIARVIRVRAEWEAKLRILGAFDPRVARLLAPGLAQASFAELRDVDTLLTPETAPQLSEHDLHTVHALAENVRQADEEARELELESASPAVQTHSDTDQGFSPARPTGGDVLMSALAGTATALAYSVTIYSDTWGSLPEFVSALTAGFVVPSLIQWTSLPVFRSVRLRSGGDGSGKAGDAGVTAGSLDGARRTAAAVAALRG